MQYGSEVDNETDVLGTVRREQVVRIRNEYCTRAVTIQDKKYTFGETYEE